MTCQFLGVKTRQSWTFLDIDRGRPKDLDLVDVAILYSRVHVLILVYIIQYYRYFSLWATQRLTQHVELERRSFVEFGGNNIALLF